MQKSSTQVKFEKITSSQSACGPKQSTINLIKQFARFYNSNEALQPGLRTVVPN